MDVIERLQQLEQEVVRLKDAEAIRRLVAEFIWYADTNNRSAARALVMDDAVIDMTAMGLPRFEGAEELDQCYAEGVHPKHKIHLYGNAVINIDGDRATGQWATLNYSPLNGTPVTSGVGVDDVYVRTPAGWRFASRRYYYLAPRSIPRPDDEHVFGEDHQIFQTHDGTVAHVGE